MGAFHARTRLLPFRLTALLMTFFLLPNSPPVSFFLLGTRTRLLPYRVAALMMAFFLILPSSPVFLLILASGNQDLPPGNRVRLSRLLLHPYLVSPSTLWAHSLSFSLLPSPPLPTPSPQQPPALASVPIPSPLLPSLPSLFASLHSLLLHLRQVAQCTMPSPIFADIACHYVSFCRSLIPHPSSPPHTSLDT